MYSQLLFSGSPGMEAGSFPCLEAPSFQVTSCDPALINGMGAESYASFTCPDFPSVQLEAEDSKMAEPHKVGGWILESHLEDSCLGEHSY